LLNQGMNANCASHPKVSLGLGFKNSTKEDSYLKSQISNASNSILRLSINFLWRSGNKS
jgi:hypothetical protein